MCILGHWSTMGKIERTKIDISEMEDFTLVVV
jgi:hypothetical protein